MQTIVYNGSFEGFLSAVFDVYEYKFTDVTIEPAHKHQPSLFAEPHVAKLDLCHSERVWKGLRKKLTNQVQDQIRFAFFSEMEGIENILLQYIQSVFASAIFNPADFTNTAVQTVFQMAKKVQRESHRIETSVRFQQTTDGLSYAVIDPHYDVLPLLAEKFRTKYANQHWMIYDTCRRYGLYYDLKAVTTVQIKFTNETAGSQNNSLVYDESDALYQQLWKPYFKSLTAIAASKNTKLHICQRPRHYWKSLPEKSTMAGGSLQDRLTNWTYRRA